MHIYKVPLDWLRVARVIARGVYLHWVNLVQKRSYRARIVKERSAVEILRYQHVLLALLPLHFDWLLRHPTLLWKFSKYINVLPT